MWYCAYNVNVFEESEQQNTNNKCIEICIKAWRYKYNDKT